MHAGLVVVLIGFYFLGYLAKASTEALPLARWAVPFAIASILQLRDPYADRRPALGNPPEPAR